MSVSIAQLDAWMQGSEDEHLEFKEARTQYNTEELVKYCTALANECGGSIVFGVTNKKPRRVVGTNAFADLTSIKAKLVDRLKLYVEASVVDHPDGRIVVFEVPSRPVGMPIPYRGAYFMRAGEGLVAMTPDRLKSIFEEADPDFSAMVCPRATLLDLDYGAIQNFRAMWRRKSGNPRLDNLSPEQLLIDAELIVDGGITYAALVLLGSRQGLGKYLSQAEVIFEYRASDAEIPYRQRKEYRLGFFGFQEDLWQTIDARNEVHHFEDGLFVGDIATFDGRVVREALLNAISHRDYRLAASTFVRQFPTKLEIVSPGGFAPGVTAENILWKQVPRNRRIAEVFSKCGLVERSGQGTRLMFEWSIREGKPRPDYSKTDAYEVFLTLRGEVQDPRFLDFMEKIGKEKLSSFSTHDFLVVDHIYREQRVPIELQDRLPRLIELGIIEAQGRGRGTRYFISRRFYRHVGKKGTYTRKRGLDRETNKALLLKHIQDNRGEGARFEELSQVLPSQSRGTIQRLMGELKDEGRIHVVGRTKAARWYPGPGKQEIAS